MSNHLSKVKEIRRSGDLGEVNQLLDQGWKLAHEVIDEYGGMEYILHRVK